MVVYDLHLIILKTIELTTVYDLAALYHNIRYGHERPRRDRRSRRRRLRFKVRFEHILLNKIFDFQFQFNQEQQSNSLILSKL